MFMDIAMECAHNGEWRRGSLPAAGGGVGPPSAGHEARRRSSGEGGGGRGGGRGGGGIDRGTEENSRSFANISTTRKGNFEKKSSQNYFTVDYVG